MLVLQLAAYAAALWLGCYLLARRPLTRPLLFTGLGLLAYAAALASGVLAGALTTAGELGHSHQWLDRVYWLLLFAPALCWCAALSALTPDAALPGWRGATLDTTGGASPGTVLLVTLASLLLVGLAIPPEWRDRLYAGAAVVILLLLFALALRARRSIPLPRARTLTLVSALFFGLGGGLLLLRLPWLPRPMLVLAIGVDLLIFGWVVAALDAFDAAEQLRADFARSLAGSCLFLAVFGGQVTFALFAGASPSDALIALLLGVVAGAIAVPTFWDHLQRALDRIVFGARSPISDRRAALLATAATVARHPAAVDLLALSEEEFAALVRRALSHFGDLPKLAASPLTRLLIVDRRLRSRGAAGDVLERATELKAVLAESIARLKPPDEAAFGTTDEWRHYNALYFLYVAGIRPYSRRLTPAPSPSGRLSAAGDGQPAAASEAALRWFRTQVPERTLHNWQRAAARLVALDLRERARADVIPTPPVSPIVAADGSTFPSHGSA